MTIGDKELFFDVEKKANELRIGTLEMCIKAGTGHVTSSMSCAEILAFLYHGGIVKHDPKEPKWDERDRFVLSKGQASPILYVALADRGFFPKEWLGYFAKGVDGTGKDAPFGVHLQCDVPGVEFTTGSLGHGLGYGVGIADAALSDGKSHKAFVLLGDAELYEGSNWEAAIYAGSNNLSNLIAIVDRNGMGVNGKTEMINRIEPLDDKFRSFGWRTYRVNGHDVSALYKSYRNNEKAIEQGFTGPAVIIADTIKGRGIASMTDKLHIHGLAPKGEEAVLAVKELEEFSRKHIENGGYV